MVDVGIKRKNEIELDLDIENLDNFPSYNFDRYLYRRHAYI